MPTARFSATFTHGRHSPPTNTAEGKPEEYAPINSLPPLTDLRVSPGKTALKTRIIQWLRRQLACPHNRYACQTSVGFTIAALFVIVDPISNIIPNAFWIGVSVVTVLDNTLGGFLNLGLQRMIGTIMGGSASIVVMTVTRAIFPIWSWHATLLLSVLMFCQVFVITKIKLMPNMSYAGGIGLVTTVILLLPGYQEIVHDRLSKCAELGAWRILSLIIGIVIALLSSLCIFPLKASQIMRTNLGDALTESADMFESTVNHFVVRGEKPKATVTEQLSKWAPELDRMTFKKALTRTFSTIKPEHITVDQPVFQLPNDLWELGDNCPNNNVFSVLKKLEIESTRLRNVSNEFYLQIPFRVCMGNGRRRDRVLRDMRRAKRYSDAIEAMKRIVWPIVSFRLLLPLVRLSQDGSQKRIMPEATTLVSFHASTDVMRRIANILKDTRHPLSDYAEEWYALERIVNNGHMQIQQELFQVVHVGLHIQSESHSITDGAKLLSHYGFLVRCSMIWEGLKTVISKLSPRRDNEQGDFTSGTATPLPARDFVNVTE